MSFLEARWANILLFKPSVFERIYFSPGCTEALGVQSNAIPDSAMTASSSLSSISQPHVARLYAPQASGIQGVIDSRGGWSPHLIDQKQYLQVSMIMILRLAQRANSKGVLQFAVLNLICQIQLRNRMERFGKKLYKT